MSLAGEQMNANRQKMRRFVILREATLPGTRGWGGCRGACDGFENVAV